MNDETMHEETVVETHDEWAYRQATNLVRTKRDKLIAATDHMLLPDYPNKPGGLETYRQELRDITAQVGFPDDVDWPEL